jgi:molybdopterin-containing oxidoreductase family iron-sulfur binding subunit
MNETTMNQEAMAAGSAARVEGKAQVVTAIAPATPTGAQAARKKMTLAEVRARLDGQTGRRFWKNLDELAETSEFQEMMHEDGRMHQAAG